MALLSANTRWCTARKFWERFECNEAHEPQLEIIYKSHFLFVVKRLYFMANLWRAYRCIAYWCSWGTIFCIPYIYKFWKRVLTK